MFWLSELSGSVLLIIHHLYFLLNEQPSVNLALPPVGVHKTVEHESQVTAVWACENTVVMFKHPWHLTSMKYDLGAWTKVFNLCCCASVAGLGCNKSLTKTWGVSTGAQGASDAVDSRSRQGHTRP